MTFEGGSRRVVPATKNDVDKLERELRESRQEIADLAQALSAGLDGASRRLDSLSSLMTSSGRGDAFYLVAESGFPNYGDELIAREWLRYLARIRPDVPVFLDCACAGNAAQILWGVHPRLTVVDTVSMCGRDAESRLGMEGLVEDMGDEVLRALELRGDSRYAVAACNIAESVRSVHYLGGGYLNGMWKGNLARLALAVWARGRGVPVLMTGTGLEPLEDSDVGYVRGAVAGCLAVGVRDEVSYGYLSGLPNCSLTPDDCFVNGLDGCLVADERALPATMLCVQADLVDDVASLYAHVERTLEAWGVRKDEAVGVVECNPRFDRGIYDYLNERGWRLEFFPTLFLLREGFPARAGQRWLSTRYHPHLIASSLGCSGSYISVSEDYYDAKHEAALRMGSRWTRSVVGQEPPAYGEGFADPDARYAYRDEIRRFASVLYGLA